MDTNPKQEWNYTPTNGKKAITALSIASITGFGVALSQIFNPMALGVAAGYGILKTAYDYLGKSPEAEVKELIRDGYLEPLENNHPLQTTIDELADACQSRPLTGYYATHKFLRKHKPFYLRRHISDIVIQEIATNYAAANSSLDIILTTKDFLNNHKDDEIRWTMAHEIAHCKNNDSCSAHAITKTFKKHAVRALTTGYTASILPNLMGISSISTVLASDSLAYLIFTPYTMYMACKLTNIGLNAASRIQERRADRNAVYLTGEKDAGINFLKRGNEIHRHKFLELYTHPTFYPREKNIKQAFNEAAKFSAPQTVRKIEYTKKTVLPASKVN